MPVCALLGPRAAGPPDGPGAGPGLAELRRRPLGCRQRPEVAGVLVGLARSAASKGWGVAEFGGCGRVGAESSGRRRLRRDERSRGDFGRWRFQRCELSRGGATNISGRRWFLPEFIRIFTAARCREICNAEYRFFNAIYMDLTVVETVSRVRESRACVRRLRGLIHAQRIMRFPPPVRRCASCCSSSSRAVAGHRFRSGGWRREGPRGVWRVAGAVRSPNTPRWFPVQLGGHLCGLDRRAPVRPSMIEVSRPEPPLCDVPFGPRETLRTPVIPAQKVASPC
ncbi:hypothetical protein SAMN05660976_06467 [Nonomuraea pusilla]|uniref:Uncharacterized protein n=1 Tax=Nonomuraea pusilla TaxID=46177 RepID=A0A1H8CL37_9ACTN|nr:hypothetical protein SAMN05660976_06467 [Nonomuraea pusilla]